MANLSPLLLALLIACGAEGGMQLKRVVIISRHGDRAPNQVFPSYPYTSYWKAGLGQLTTLGMRQHYQLGQYIRRQYGKILSTFYSVDGVKVYSADIDRCIMSVQANLAGLFPPRADQIFEQGLNWQPIPVHVEEAIVEWTHALQCPVFVEERRETLDSGTYISIQASNEDLLEYLSINTGSQVTLHDMFNLGDVIISSRAHNLSLPNWMTAQVQRDIISLREQVFALDYFTGFQRRTQAGPLLNFLVPVLDHLTKKKCDQNLTLLAVHDNNIAALQFALGFWKDEMPRYAASIFLEIYENNKGEIFVKTKYQNPPDALELQIFEFCGRSTGDSNLAYCPYSDLRAQMESQTIDWDRECHAKQPLLNGLRLQILLIIASCLFVAVIFIFQAAKLRKRLHHSKGMYMSL